MFDDAIKVDANKINVLDECTINEFVTPKLDLDINQLLSIEKDITEKYFGLIEQRTAFFPKTSTGPKNLLEQKDGPQRTLLSNRHKSIEDIPLKDITFAVKGSGLWNWTNSQIIFHDEKKTQRLYPITKNNKPRFASHTFWGGMDQSFATHEYISALILNALIKRHALPQSTYEPISIIKPQIYPIMENKTQKIVNIEEYGKKGFHNPDKSKHTVPKKDEMQTLVQYIYVGDRIGLRVPPQNYWHMYSLVSTQGILSEKYKSRTEMLKSVDNFVFNIASLLKMVHSYNGTFTSISKEGNISSLEKSNVTIGGIVCDLDTLSFGDASKKHKRIDIGIAMDTITNYIHLFDEEKIPIFLTGYVKTRHAKNDLVSAAKNLFMEYMEIPKRTIF